MTDVQKLLNRKPEVRRVPVDYKFETGQMVPQLDDDRNPIIDKTTKEPVMVPEVAEVHFVMQGLPDNYLAHLQLLPANSFRGKAVLFESALKDDRGIEAKYTDDDVKMGLLILHYLSPETPITEMELAYMAKEHGLLFTALLEGATKVMANKGEDNNLEAGLKNSSAGNGAPASSSDASSLPESTPEQS